MYSYKPLPTNKAPLKYAIYDGDILTAVCILEWSSDRFEGVDYFEGRMNSGTVSTVTTIEQAFKDACDYLDMWKEYGQPRYAE